MEFFITHPGIAAIILLITILIIAVIKLLADAFTPEEVRMQKKLLKAQRKRRRRKREKVISLEENRDRTKKHAQAIWDEINKV